MKTTINNPLKGKRFGKLLILKDFRDDYFNELMVLAKCDCGNEKEIDRCNILAGHTKSCGCLRKNATHRITHGQRGTPLYQLWNHRKCEIEFDDRWKDFANFSNDVGGLKPDGMTIVPIDPDLPFGKNNFQFVESYWMHKNQIQFKKDGWKILKTINLA